MSAGHLDRFHLRCFHQPRASKVLSMDTDLQRQLTQVLLSRKGFQFLPAARNQQFVSDKGIQLKPFHVPTHRQVIALCGSVILRSNHRLLELVNTPKMYPVADQDDAFLRLFPILALKASCCPAKNQPVARHSRKSLLSHNAPPPLEPFGRFVERFARHTNCFQGVELKSKSRAISPSIPRIWSSKLRASVS